MNKLKLLLLGLILYSCNQAQTFTKVVSIYDGDTFTVSDGTVIRMADIDCPEVGQTYWLECKKLVVMLLQDKEVTLSNKRLDKYGRTVADVHCHSVYINELLVTYGYAWAYNKYSPAFHKLQVIARQLHRGLWKYEAIPPFLYRKQHKIR